MTTTCGYEFQVRHFGFTDSNTDHFHESQWGKNRIIYLIYRILIFIYSLSWIIADVSITPQPFYAIFLTNWSEVGGCLHFFLSLLTAVYGIFTMHNQNKGLLWFHKVGWIIFEAVIAAALVTDLLFWISLSSLLPAHALSNPFNIHEHAINYVLLVIDLFVHAIPIRLLHFPYTAGFGLVYTIFSLILHGTNVNSKIYPILDWKGSPGYAALYTLLASLIAMPLAHMFHFGLYHLRACIARSCGKAESSSENETELGGETNRTFQ